MKALKAIGIAAVLVAFIGCDDDWIMDLEPPYGGYIWRVSNGTSGYVGKLNPVDATWIEGYGTPFGPGYNYDAAAGNGRVWVAGLMYIDDSPGLYIWEVNGDTFRAPAHGLTWDGEHLFGGGGNYIYRIDPDTHESEVVLTAGDTRFGDAGLAWDGNCFWSLLTTRKVIFQLDPNNGDILHSINLPYPIEGPRGLTWDGEALWVNDAKTDRLYRVSPKDGSILGYHEMSPPGRLPPPAPYGLAFEFPSE